MQNNSKYVNTPHQVSSHHRSFSMDQMYSLPQNMYTNHGHSHHSRSISYDNLETMTTPPMMLNSSTGNHSTSSNTNINVNGVLNNCYTPHLNTSQHQQQQNLMNSFTTSLPQAPQAYTAACDPNMNVSHSTVPPSSLNWSDWDVYIGHHNTPQQTRTSSSPPQNMNFP
jgi:hypothetical protein